MLSLEERNDLRKRVISGQQLTLDEARAVFETLRQGQAAVIIQAGEAKPKKTSKKKEAISDAALDADLADLGL